VSRGSNLRVLALAALLVVWAVPVRAKTVRSLDRALREGTRVSVKGKFLEPGVFEAGEIELRRDKDDDEELRGSIDDVDSDARTISLLGFTVEVGSDAPITLEPDGRASFADLRPGVRVKVDGGRDREGLFVAEKVKIRRNQKYRERRIVGLILDVRESDRGVAELEIVGLTVIVKADTELVSRRGNSLPVVSRRLGVVDDDDLLFTGRRRIGQRVALAGEVRLRGELLSNPDLDDDTDDDELVPQVAGIIGFAADLGPVFAYAELQGAREYFIYAEDDFETGVDELNVGEAYFEIRGLLAPWFSVAIGRQKFKEERRWYYDRKNLDAVRFVADFRRARVEASISRDVFDESRNLRDQDLLNTIVQAEYDVNDDLVLQGFYIDRDDRTEMGDSLRIYGLRVLADPGRRFELWADLSFENGTVCTRVRTSPAGATDSGQSCGREQPQPFLARDVRAHAFDLGVTYRPRVRLDPTFTVAYALGSGENDDVLGLPLAEQSETTATSYRQSGLERNRGKYNGVVSFRYYGEVLDPVLTNLSIATVGAGLRPRRSYSIDLMYRRYRQDEASRAFHDFSIDEDPEGLDPDIGDEWDLALGYEPSRKYELRLTAGLFRPGDAFAEDAGDASVVRFQSKFRF